mgnify:CR=1 FL=1
MRLISKLNDMELRYVNIANKYKLTDYVIKLGKMHLNQIQYLQFL